KVDVFKPPIGAREGCADEELRAIEQIEEPFAVEPRLGARRIPHRLREARIVWRLDDRPDAGIERDDAPLADEGKEGRRRSLRRASRLAVFGRWRRLCGEIEGHTDQGR